MSMRDGEDRRYDHVRVRKITRGSLWAVISDGRAILQFKRSRSRWGMCCLDWRRKCVSIPDGTIVEVLEIGSGSASSMSTATSPLILVRLISAPYSVLEGLKGIVHQRWLQSYDSMLNQGEAVSVYDRRRANWEERSADHTHVPTLWRSQSSSLSWWSVQSREPTSYDERDEESNPLLLSQRCDVNEGEPSNGIDEMQSKLLDSRIIDFTHTLDNETVNEEPGRFHDEMIQQSYEDHDTYTIPSGLLDACHLQAFLQHMKTMQLRLPHILATFQDGHSRCFPGSMLRCGPLSQLGGWLNAFLPIDKLASVHSDGANALTLHFDFGEDMTSDVLAQSTGGWVLECNHKHDPFAMHPQNKAVKHTPAPRRLTISKVVRIQLESGRVQSLNRGDVSVRSMMMRLQIDVRTEHQPGRMEKDEHGRIYLCSGSDNMPIIRHGRYVPRIGDFWLVVSVLRTRESWFRLEV